MRRRWTSMRRMGAAVQAAGAILALLSGVAVGGEPSVEGRAPEGSVEIPGSDAAKEQAPTNAFQESGSPSRPACCPEPNSLTDHGFGLGHTLADKGLDIRLSATQVYQDVARGGMATHRHAGRYTGSYDFEIKADLDKLAGLKGGSLYSLTEGGWSQGINVPSVGALFNPNADALGDRSVAVAQFWYEQALASDKVRIRVGKIDLTGTFECRGCPVSFDGNLFANDETTQFLNAAFVNNPTIPFPDRGIGAVVHFEPVEGWYVSAGLGDAHADSREMGFNTAFEAGSATFSIYETGYIADLPSPNGPLRGGYRLGLWYDPQPKARFNGTGEKRDDVGMYVSVDQTLLRESNKADDNQGLGVFARFALADRQVNPIRRFWSAGVQYEGLIPGRDADVVGIGFGRGRLSDEPGAGFTAAHETLMEAYYNIEVLPCLHVSPGVQYLADPGGIAAVREVVIVGVRIQAAF